MSFIFAETQAMQSAAATVTGLADETTNAGAQGQAAGLTVLPPELGPASAHLVAGIKAYTTHIASQLASGAGLQNIYGESISNAASGYTLVDQLNATGLTELA